MRPSERIVQIAQARCLERGKQTGEYETIGVVFGIELEDVAVCLNEEAERRAAFERDVLERLGRLEALNPEARDITGTTLSGATVHGFSPLPICTDGTRVHDMRGHASCPDCGFTPKRTVGYEPGEEIDET